MARQSVWLSAGWTQRPAAEMPATPSTEEATRPTRAAPRSAAALARSPTRRHIRATRAQSPRRCLGTGAARLELCEGFVLREYGAGATAAAAFRWLCGVGRNSSPAHCLTGGDISISALSAVKTTPVQRRCRPPATARDGGDEAGALGETCAARTRGVPARMASANGSARWSQMLLPDLVRGRRCRVSPRLVASASDRSPPRRVLVGQRDRDARGFRLPRSERRSTAARTTVRDRRDMNWRIAGFIEPLEPSVEAQLAACLTRRAPRLGNRFGGRPAGRDRTR